MSNAIGSAAGPLPAVDPAEAARLRAIPLVDVVRSWPTSVRLRNAIDAGERRGQIPCPTVGDYIDAGRSAPALFMRDLWSFGRLTARELDILVHRFTAAAGVDPDELRRQAAPEPPSTEAAPIDIALERMRHLTFAEVVEGQMISTRLHNVLAQPGVGARTAAELLSNPTSVRAELLRIPNFGRKSLHELEDLCRRAAVRALANSAGDDNFQASCTALFGGHHSDDEAQVSTFVEDVLQDEPPSDCSLAELLDWAIAELKDRERDVLARRYALAGHPAETLEEISASYGVTRERIRQVESKALKKLARRLPEKRLTSALWSEAAAFWQQNGDYLVGGDKSQLKGRVAPGIFLALDVVQWSVRDWLGAAATPMHYGFLADHRDAERIREIARQLETRAAARSLPVALRELAPDCPYEEAVAATALETPLALFEGYVFAQRPGARLKRAARLHALLSQYGRAASLYEFGDAYAARWPQDGCALRDLTIVMELLPHLFLEIEEGVWCALGKGGAYEGPREAVARRAEVPPAPDGATIAGSLYEALCAHGPTRIGDLYREAATILQPGRSPASIPYILAGRPELFRRILPSVYALPDQIPSEEQILQDALPYLLTEAQARTYAHARRAGEEWGTYPLWTAAAEYRLCAWARLEAAPDIFHSLLAIARVDAWPCSAAQRDQWVVLAAQKGRFELVPGSYERDQEPRPDLDRLLAACRVAIESGRFNWIVANRIMGRRLDAMRGRGLLALMVALGTVSLPEASCDDPWNLPHPVTPRAREIAGRIEAELLVSEASGWESVLGQSLLSDALATAPERLGWVPAERLAQLLGTEATFAVEEPVDEDEDEEDVIARLRREHRHDIERERHNAIASLLLED